IKQHLPQIGEVFYARYATISSQQPVQRSWKYHREMFGFPLAAALSRIHRLTDLFGSVDTITCQNRYWDIPGSDYFTACLCNAQLKFKNGLIAEVTYGKGDVFWHSQRTLEIYGDKGVMIFKGEKGTLIQRENETEIPVTPRRGLFAQDTAMVLDYLFNQQPLYVIVKNSLYALQVANAAHESASLGQKIQIN
ncbi:MAG: Gfo/Idh/MocA family oxidoreductase, partial [Waterburya sp.]